MNARIDSTLLERFTKACDGRGESRTAALERLMSADLTANGRPRKARAKAEPVKAVQTRPPAAKAAAKRKRATRPPGKPRPGSVREVTPRLKGMR